MDEMNIDKDEYKDDEYKEDNLEAPKSDESAINKNEAENPLNDCLMLMNFPVKVIQYVIVTIS